MDTATLKELLEKAHPGPYSWTAEDYSMATLHGADYLYHHILSVSPCESCQKNATEWEWGRCTTPNKDHADLIAGLLNNAEELIASAERCKVLEAALQRIHDMAERPMCTCGVPTGTAAIKAVARQALGSGK